MARRTWLAGSVIVICSLIAAPQAVRAQPSGAIPAPAPAASTALSAQNAPPPQNAVVDLDEVIVNGIRRGDLIMPTTVTSNSAYGLNLGVLDTPRSTTVISATQLAALNVQNPGGFSYLTASSYTDASFGQPNVPRIRGQYADVFFNGMRDSFTLNGYGAPMSFNSTDSIDIVQGPASVQAGPGAGVGGAIDITTKLPTPQSFLAASLEGDTQQKRIAALDMGGALTDNTTGRISLTSNDSGSYYYGMYFHQQAIYAAGLTQFTPAYGVMYSADVANTEYRENDGINRVNQNLIDNGQYLTGAPDPATISGFLTTFDLPGTTTELNPRTIIDEPDGNGARALHAKAQIIQTLKPGDGWSLTNNTFYDYLDRYNQVTAYYADTAKNSFTIENKTDIATRFSTGSVNHSIDGGVTYRYAHVWDVQNYINEPVSVYDLSANPASWVFPSSLQEPSGAFPYSAAFGHFQWGSPGRNPYFLNDSAISNLQDAAVFLEDRIVLSPQWSVLAGLRGDLVQLNYADPLGGPGLYNGLPQSASTAWYGLRNANISVVYTITPHVSTYATYNNAQYVLPTGNDGAVSTWGEAPSSQLQQDTTLEEVGVKFDLMNKRLFISSDVYHQTRSIPIGVGLTNTSANISGFEFQANYQPSPAFFATASYSYLHTLIYSPSGATPSDYFYNFPAYAGTIVDGAGTFAIYQPNQSMQDPGVPQHLFNVLANYKHPSGFGVQGNVQVTGPIYTTQPGYLNVAATNAYFGGALVGAGGLVPLSIVGANGYYNAPRIPWQYTINTAFFYRILNYQIKLSIYNLTNERNLLNDLPFYGNDFLTRVPPRSYDLTLSARF